MNMTTATKAAKGFDWYASGKAKADAFEVYRATDLKLEKIKGKGKKAKRIKESEDKFVFVATED